MTPSGPSLKTMRDQVRELQKLVLDAQDRLDLAVRGLRLLEDRLNADAGPASSTKAPGQH
jgi:isoaspartyl peptidase/L-asparaginase-like protein (Ntn-hydrolase superfamily)